MKIYTRAGELLFREFTFPDGQPHFELLHRNEFSDCVIETAIRSGHELLAVLLAKDALTASGYTVSLDIRYLLGARMDRPIYLGQPFTLAVVARALLAAGFRHIRVLDPHSAATTALLGCTSVLPLAEIKTVLAELPLDTLIVAPDAGAAPRVEQILRAIALMERYRVVQGVKNRDAASGELSGFGVLDATVVRDRPCLIVDDICDGGGTFVGLAKELHAAGALAIDLFVTHGIFSKGPRLNGIRRIYTTDSFQQLANSEELMCFQTDMSSTLR